jgi:hypothetical protein
VAISVLVIRRSTDDRLALASIVCLGVFLALLLNATASAKAPSSLTILASPWNPTAILLPTLALLVLGAAAIEDAAAMAAFLIVGSVLVQATVSTAPLVGVLSLVVIAAAGWQRVSRRRAQRSSPEPRQEGDRLLAGRWPRRTVLFGALGAVVLVALWSLPLYQELASGNGNLSAIVSFFRAQRHTISVDGLLRPFALVSKAIDGPLHLHPGTLLAPTPMTWVVFGLVVIVIVGAGLLSRGPRVPAFARRLLVLGSIGVLVSMYSATAIVGKPFDYLLKWSWSVLFAVVLAAALIVVSALFASASHRIARRPRISLLLPTAGVLVLVLVLSFEVAAQPGLSPESTSSITRYAHQVEAELRSTEEPTRPAIVATTLEQTQVARGIINQLDRDGVALSLGSDEFDAWGNGQYGLHGTLSPGPYRSVTTIDLGRPPSTAVTVTAKGGR